MSHASVRPASIQKPLLEELVTIVLKLMTTSIDTTRSVMALLPSLLPSMPDLRLQPSKHMCEIPEIECPPRCVCEVTWEASPGETPGLIVHVTNASKLARTFQLHATEFTGIDRTSGTIAVAPSVLTLQAGHAGVANATFSVPNVPEGEYDAEILVEGAYEQCVRVRLKVRCEKTCGEERCTCDVVQGDPPARVRAHHWYDHFQCTEPCVEPTLPAVEAAGKSGNRKA